MIDCAEVVKAQLTVDDLFRQYSLAEIRQLSEESL